MSDYAHPERLITSQSMGEFESATRLATELITRAQDTIREELPDVLKLVTFNYTFDSVALAEPIDETVRIAKIEVSLDTDILDNPPETDVDPVVAMTNAIIKHAQVTGRCRHLSSRSEPQEGQIQTQEVTVPITPWYTLSES